MDEFLLIAKEKVSYDGKYARIFGLDYLLLTDDNDC